MHPSCLQKSYETGVHISGSRAGGVVTDPESARGNDEDDHIAPSCKLKKPLGDRKMVTVGDKPMTEIHPDMDSWFTVLKKLATGG